MFRNSQNPLPKALLSLGIILAFFWVLVTFNSFQQEDESKTTNSTYLTENLDKAGYLDEKLPISTDKTLNSFREWCQIDYQDLSKDSVFLEFQVWMKKFESSNEMDVHRKVKLKQVLQEGEKLAQRRAKVLQKIIRGDPHKALELAIPQNILELLPIAVAKHLERWESDFADIEAMHVCFDPEHPGGYINRTATMQDGRRLRTWVFGKRKNLPSIKNLSVWGVSIEEDFALSEFPIEKKLLPDINSLVFGGNEYAYSNSREFELFEAEVKEAERLAYLHRIPVSYPHLATSSGLTDYYEQKYDLIVNPSTWQEAKKAAEDSNGTLVVINSKLENRFIRSLLEQDQENYPGYDESNNTVDMVWIGATDFEDENSSYFDIENNTSRIIELNATEGDWKWLDGTDVNNSSYKNWFNNQEPNSAGDYAAMDWSTSGGTWVDVNGSYRLPFVIEYQLENEPTPITTPIDGHRKVLIVPARFSDEGLNYEGSTGPLVDEFGNPIFTEIQQDAYEPVSQENLANAMKQVKEFYLRNSDGTFHLDAVITPTVTIPYSKYTGGYGTGNPNLFDSSGNFIQRVWWSYDAKWEMEFANSAAEEVAKMDEAWDWDGPAFRGVVEVTVSSIPNPQAYETPPIISFSGGDQDPADNNRSRQRFESAKAEAVTDGQGRIVGIKVLDSGAYYFSTPTLLVNGVESPDYSFTISLDNICVSYVGITTNNKYGAAGVGYVGNPGSHVDADANGDVSATTIVHELGHNFGLLHANRLVTLSERPNSDESKLIDYGNPYSVMGTAPINNDRGDLTVAEKVITKSVGNFGLTYGTSQGVDVAHILTFAEWTNSPFRMGPTEGLPENTFRIYRHDYEDGPLALKAESFDVFIPQNDLDNSLIVMDTNYSLSFIGTGEGAGGKLKLVTPYTGGPNAQLTIDSPGSGFSSEPNVIVTKKTKAVLKDAIILSEQPSDGDNLDIVFGDKIYNIIFVNSLNVNLHANSIQVKIQSDASQSMNFLVAAINGSQDTNNTSYGSNLDRSVAISGLYASTVNGTSLDLESEEPGDYSIRVRSTSFSENTTTAYGTETTLLSLDPTWVKKQNGMDTSGNPTSYAIVELRDDGNESNRGLRGLHLKASDVSPKGMDYDDENLDAFWLSYRWSASQYGLSILSGNSYNPENFLIDIGLNTPGDFSDAFLMLGHTFSDYDSDVHITPFKHGGTNPMEYIDVIVNKGTVNSGASVAPDFSVKVSNRKPAVGEYIQISAQVSDNNVSGYSYGWFTDEVIESELESLNKPSILKSFSRAGQFVIRVVVSDLKGGISSRNVVIQVGDYEKSSFSSISGTVRANQGFIEGARVAISPASVVEHTIGIKGASNDSHIPSATNTPATFLIDGLSAPNLTLSKGEIHRFYFDASVQGFPITFLEHPEHEVPRVRMNMLVSPVVDIIGEKYSNPPLVAVDEVSSFATYFSNEKGTVKVGTIQEFYAGYLEESSSENLFITRPFAKSLLTDTEVETIFIRPTELDIDGNYIKFGGKGHDRDNPPEVYIYRSSLWEDYQDPNATAQAYVDGVGTISPVTSLDFYETIWETRSSSDPIPELVVWGSGGNEARPYINRTGEEESSDSNETHATVAEYVDTQNRNVPYRTIAISDQGILFEPDSTMAVLQYPLDPIAYWTFDRHESLFEEAADGRYQPSPAWNAMQMGMTDIFPYDLKLTQYWSFDDESGTSVSSSKDGTIGLPFDLSDDNRSEWGVKGRAVRLNGTDSVTIGSVASSGSLSLWLKPEGNFTFDLNGVSLTYDHTTRTCTYATSSITRRTTSYDWMHLAIVNNDSNSSFYVDGMSSSISVNGGTLSTANFAGLLDEIHIFSSALSEAEVKILGGRSFLDLSGNKVHAVPIGPDFNMSSPDTDLGLSTDRPFTASHASPKGAKSPSFGYKLGDSYLGEDHGRSLYFDDNDSYIDVSPHAFYFAGEDQGSISFWVKTSGGADQNIFTASCREDNASFFRIMLRETGVMQLHAVNDETEISKFRTESSSSSRVNDNEWHHITLVSDGEKSVFWVDGKQIVSLPYEDNGDNSAFFSDIENLDFVAIGSSFYDPYDDTTDNFLGNIDDFYIYNRALNSTEINYLYDLRKGREQLPRLEAVVDAVGSIKITSTGEGYKETPNVVLTYGMEGNSTSDLTPVADLATLNAMASPTDGKLYYVTEEAKVYSYHQVRQETDWRHDNSNNGWVEYQLAYGLAGLNNDSPKGGVDQILWTKDMTKLVPLTLPDGTIVNRQYHEYVVKGDGIFAAPSGNYGVPHGLFGYTAPPNLIVANPKTTEEGGEENATAHALFFADLNHTAEIKNPGYGLTSTGFEANQTLRISGKGYRPDQWEMIEVDGVFRTDYDLVRTAYAEYWGQDKDGNYSFEPTTQFDDNLDWVRLPGHVKPLSTLTSMPLGSSANELDLIFGTATTPEAIFSDWTHQPEIGEPRNVILDFNKTLSHVSLHHTGFGYSMPAEVLLVSGFSPGVDYPNWVATGNQTSYSFIPAEFQIGSVDGNGSILTIVPTSTGSGYLEAPTVVISGGGGFGAEAEAELDGTGGIASITVESGGRGYFNTDANNAPTANLVHAPPLFGSELDANLSVRLGGYLGEIGRCSACVSGDHAHKENQFTSKFYHHLDAWVEIWDRNRTEEEIDENGDRALASAKIRNGVIEKVVVVKSGRGYIDPIVRVRGIPPHHNHFTDIKSHKDFGVWGSDRNRIPSDKVTRHWRCVNPREDKVGNLVECGHIFEGQYPPEQCPGEVDEGFPLGEASTSQAITDWLSRHIPNGDHPHQHCDASYYGYDNSKHLTASFRSRRCGGTKANFVLLNDLYRTPYESWEPFDANLSALVEGGRIQEIVVLSGGSMYAASEVFAEGSGTGVDAIPIYDERGENVRVIYDDSRLKNLENDFQVIVPSFLKLKHGEVGEVVLDYNVFLPDGAGQGFQERPWSWDWLGSNNPSYGPREKVLARTVKSEEVSEIFFTDDAVNWSFGSPQLLDNLGDRIMDIRVDGVGLFDSNRSIQDVNIIFSSNHLPDVDWDGMLDFVPASATAFDTFRLTGFQLDENGTFKHGDRNQSRSLYVEEPVVNILPHLSTTNMNTETASSFFRLNGQVEYDTQAERTYFDLYVDDNLPSKFYYGFGSNADGLPAMGGEIIVTEGLPAMSWGKNEPQERNMTAYTDQNGYYFIPNLEPGFYNVGVFLEDRKFQDSTFRPDSNLTRVSEVLYVPGFPDLLLETDSRGAGVSRLVWSSESRKLSRPDPASLAEAVQNENEYEQKKLEGIGGGFRQGEMPELIILPGPMNSNDILPNIIVDVLMDGTLKLEIIDDENTTAYNPDDRFTIGYSSNVQGVNFREFYQFSESNKSNWGGSGDSELTGIAWMEIFPNDSNGTGVLEVPLETGQTGSNPFEFEVRAYEANGSQIDTSGAQWNLVLTFDPPEQNQSLVAELSQKTGSSTSLTLTSTLRESGIVDFEILSSGTAYQGNSKSKIVLSGESRGFEGTVQVNADGNVTGVEVLNSGSGYSNDNTASIERVANGFTGKVVVNADGNVTSIEIEEAGSGYSTNDTASIERLANGFMGKVVVNADGNVTSIEIEEAGSGYSTNDFVTIDLARGNSARLSPVLGGKLYLDANITTPSGQVLKARTQVFASTRNILTEEEKWLDLYFDSIKSRDSTWWESDLDDDNLTNSEEKVYGTHPNINDTDGDGLSDGLEIKGPDFVSNTTDDYNTNPHQADTDGDGLTDYSETLGDPYNNNVLGFNIDSAGSGYTNGSSVSLTSVTGMGSNFSGTITVDTDGKITGIVITNPGYQYNLNDTISISGGGSGANLSLLLGDGTDPRKFDSDKDGMSDGFEVNLDSEGIDVSPVNLNSNGKTVGGYIFNPKEYSGNLFIKVKPVIDGDPSSVTEDYKWPWQPMGNTYPQLYTFKNLPMENNESKPITYQVSVFLDTFPSDSPNESYDKGEPSSFWRGVLTANKFSANLFLQMDPPDIRFEPSNDSVIILPDDKNESTFSLSVEAQDLLHGIWYFNSTSPTIDVLEDTLGSYLSLDRSNSLAAVDKSIPLGTYSITYQANTDESQSKVLTQTIHIKDTKGPQLVLLGKNPYPHPHASSWVDPGWLVSDNRDQNSSILVTNSDPPDTDTIGTYTITYQAIDRAGNITSKQREVEIIDDKEPTIVVSNSVVLVSKGQSFTLPTYSATDNLDGDLTASIGLTGVENVNVNVVGDYQIQLVVTDSAGNPAQLSFIIRVEPPAYAINGNAIDGYLVGAKVIFDANGNGQSDLASTVYTKENGEFSLSFSQDELLLFDLNSNGILDANEGRIMVSGGVDSSTNEPFPGTLLADPNATVVTPLTSLITGLIGSGISKSDAEQLLSNKFSLPQEVDLTTFDPYENAANGDHLSGDILVAGARVATLMKQTEAFIRLLKGSSYNSGEASTALTSILAAKMKENENRLSNPLDDGIAEIITSVVSDQVATNLFTTEEVADFVQIVQVSDSLHKTLIKSDKSPAVIATEITKQQLAVKQSVLDELEGIENLQSVSSTISLQTLQDSSETFLEVNLFAPTADDFNLVIDNINFSSNQKMVSLQALDLDGDEINYSILSGNVDSDGDGIDFVKIDQEGNLVLQDAGEISNLISQKLSLSISLSDSKGKTNTITGVVRVENALVMESTVTSADSWMNSSWLGNFHKSGGPWIFHEKLGWQYLYKLPSGGYWFWDKEDSFWWWSSLETFPYAYDHSSGSWIFFDFNSSQVKVYNFNDGKWRNK